MSFEVTWLLLLGQESMKWRMLSVSSFTACLEQWKIMDVWVSKTTLIDTKLVKIFNFQYYVDSIKLATRFILQNCALQYNFDILHFGMHYTIYQLNVSVESMNQIRMQLSSISTNFLRLRLSNNSLKVNLEFLN